MKVYIQFIHLIFYFLHSLFMLAQFLRAVAYQTDHGREERERERENEPRNGIIYIIEKNFPSSIDRSGCSLASTIYGACQHISRDRLNRLLIHSYLTYASFCRRKIMADWITYCSKTNLFRSIEVIRNDWVALELHSIFQIASLSKPMQPLPAHTCNRWHVNFDCQFPVAVNWINKCCPLKFSLKWDLLVAQLECSHGIRFTNVSEWKLRLSASRPNFV